MQLIIGLGNPGEKYKNNRHNVGCLVIDELQSKRLPVGIVVKKTGVFMNSSGESVKKLVEQYGIKTPELWVIHDDLDIPLGSYKIQKGVGPKVHYGVNSIEEALGTHDFWRVRVGVDNREPDNRIPGEEYVLQDFTPKEEEILSQTINRLVKELYGKLF